MIVRSDKTTIEFKGLHIFGLVITTRKNIEDGMVKSYIDFDKLNIVEE